MSVRIPLEALVATPGDPPKDALILAGPWFPDRLVAGVKIAVLGIRAVCGERVGWTYSPGLSELRGRLQVTANATVSSHSEIDPGAIAVRLIDPPEPQTEEEQPALLPIRVSLDSRDPEANWVILGEYQFHLTASQMRLLADMVDYWRTTRGESAAERVTWELNPLPVEEGGP